MLKGTSRRGGRRVLLAIACGLSATVGWAAPPKDQKESLDLKAFVKPELYITSSHLPVEEALPQMPNRADWESFFTARGENPASPRLRAFVDPRSGAVTNFVDSVPLIPGDGVGNRLTLADLEARLGRPTTQVGASEVEAAVRQHLEARKELFGIDRQQLGAARVTQVTPDLWQISFPQEYKGVRVRDGRLAATISHGNLIFIGAETWGDVRGLDTTPAISGTQAVDAGFAYAEGRTPEDVILRAPTLEIVPVAPPELQHGEDFAGPVGQGYGHRLVWTWVFQRPPDEARWEVMLDAHGEEVIAFQALNELIVNGGFEGSCSPWLQRFAVRCVQGGPFPHTGTGYTVFGQGNSQIGRMFQQVTIPAATSPDLTFWLNVATQETTTTQANDRLFVEVRDTSNALLARLAIYSNLDAGPYSQKGPFNLGAFAGQTIRMYFSGLTNASLLTSFRLDDVSLTSP